MRGGGSASCFLPLLSIPVVCYICQAISLAAAAGIPASGGKWRRLPRPVAGGRKRDGTRGGTIGSTGQCPARVTCKHRHRWATKNTLPAWRRRVPTCETEPSRPELLTAEVYGAAVKETVDVAEVHARGVG